MAEDWQGITHGVLQGKLHKLALEELKIPVTEQPKYAMLIAVNLDDSSGVNDPPAGCKSLRFTSISI